tara:strand:- start:384 stop:1319 length:936 start_codon:yes stop_codon:yes gene_type:complete
MFEYILKKFEKEKLLKLCEKVNSSPKNIEIFLKEAKEAAHELPESLKEILYEFKHSEYAALLLKNLYIDRGIETPSSNMHHIGETTLLGKVQAIINCYIGEMVSYEAEGDGRLFQDMVPNETMQDSQTSLSSKAELELHTEQAFSELRPDYLSLACLKGASDAKTYLLDIYDLMDSLDIEDICLLKQSLWNIGVDLSFKMNGCSDHIRGPIPIISVLDQSLQLNFDQDLMIGLNEEAKLLSEKIIRIYYEQRKHIVLKPGNLLIINNHKAVHGRSIFTPNFDGNDRFIIRSFIMKNLDKTMGKHMVLKEFS